VQIIVGENAYEVDLKRYPIWGKGFSLIYNPKYFYLEQTYVREDYKDNPVHSTTALGWTWGKSAYMMDPDHFIKIKHYQKNDRNNKGEWYVKSSHESIEHQKIVLEAQFSPIRALKFHFEAFAAHDYYENENFKNPAFTSEMLINTQYFFNNFYMRHDKLNIWNESERRINYNNDLNIRTKYFDLFAYGQYIDEIYRPNWTTAYNQIAHSAFGNAYIKWSENYAVRAKAYNTQTQIEIVNSSTTFNETEMLFGLMYRNPHFEAEALFGARMEEFETAKEKASNNIIDVNLSYNNMETNNFSVSLYNRVTYDDLQTNVESQANIFKRWNKLFSHSTGIYNMQYEHEEWKNFLSAFHYFFFRFPWKHELKIGGTYNLNTSYTENYRYSLTAEYGISFDMKVIPKMGTYKRNIRLLDPWQRKPVVDAIWDIDNQYYITNAEGIIRLERAKLNTKNISIMNLPENTTTFQDLTTLAQSPDYRIDVRLTEYSRLDIFVKKLSYEKVNVSQADNFRNLAYYQNNLINLDKHTLDTFTDKLEIILRNTNDRTKVLRGFLKSNGSISFDKITEGEWEIAISDSYIKDDLELDNTEKIRIYNNEKREIQLTVKEKVTPFTRFEGDR
jgi:hypothetical protein